MCTIILAYKVFKDFPVVVAANRDELLDRPSEPPCLRDAGLQIFAPKDLQRGGSWIGINGFGVLSGLTNRADIKSKPGRMSRGAIIMQALERKSAFLALEYMRGIRGEELNGFNMIIVDALNAFLLRGTGENISIAS
ncbi:MAG: NRDE family protein, partial [Patescibacteria group bacterium]